MAAPFLNDAELPFSWLGLNIVSLGAAFSSLLYLLTNESIHMLLGQCRVLIVKMGAIIQYQLKKGDNKHSECEF